MAAILYRAQCVVYMMLLTLYQHNSVQQDVSLIVNMDDQSTDIYIICFLS